MSQVDTARMIEHRIIPSNLLFLLFQIIANPNFRLGSAQLGCLLKLTCLIGVLIHSDVKSLDIVTLMVNVCFG